MHQICDVCGRMEDEPETKYCPECGGGLVEDKNPPQVPEKLQAFMYGLVKNAQRDSFVDFLDNWNIDYDKDWPEIRAWFKQFGIEL